MCNVHNSCAPWLQKCYFIINNVGEVDEPYLREDVVPNTSSLDMESVHLETTLLLKNEVL
jgi:hypothetical protein